LDDDDLLLCTEEDPVMIHDLEEGEAEPENWNNKRWNLFFYQHKFSF
jgi:hypothetical protein